MNGPSVRPHPPDEAPALFLLVRWAQRVNVRPMLTLAAELCRARRVAARQPRPIGGAEPR